LLAVEALAAWDFANQPCELLVDQAVHCNSKFTTYQSACQFDLEGEVYILHV
jgi:hypothetical protein